MKITAIRTPLITAHDNLLGIIATCVPRVPERSILVVTSKVVALWEGAVAPAPRTVAEKHALVAQESDFYIDPGSSQYGLSLTIRDSNLGVNAGIDESNVAEGFVLLPENAYDSAKNIWRFIREEYQVKEVGVIISDSMSLPLKWGVIGRSLGHCGFEGLRNEIGSKDLFGRTMQMTTVAVAEAVAAAAVFQMGEVAESTPLCLVEDVSTVAFQDRPPTKDELAALTIDRKDDVFAPLLATASWRKGGRSA